MRLRTADRLCSIINASSPARTARRAAGEAALAGIEDDEVDGQYSQLRRAGSLLYEAGFDPRPAGQYRPWQGR